MLANWFGDWDLFNAVFGAMRRFACWLVEWLFEWFYEATEFAIDQVPPEFKDHIPMDLVNDALGCGYVFYPVGKILAILSLYFVWWSLISAVRIVIKLIPWIG